MSEIACYMDAVAEGAVLWQWRVPWQQNLRRFYSKGWEEEDESAINRQDQMSRPA